MRTEPKKAFNPARYLPGAFSDVRMGEDVWGLRGKPWFNSLIMLFFMCLMVGLLYYIVWHTYLHNKEIPVIIWWIIFLPMVLFYLSSLSHGVVIDFRGRTVHVWVDYHFFIRWRTLPLDDLTAIELNEDPGNCKKALWRLADKKRFYVAMVFPDEKLDVFWGMKPAVRKIATKLESFVETPEKVAEGFDVEVRDNESSVPQFVRLILRILALIASGYIYVYWFDK